MCERYETSYGRAPFPSGTRFNLMSKYTMTKSISIYPDGVDCVWIASDKNGNLGAFATGGIGPIPVPALTGGILIDEIEETLCQLPRISEVQLLVAIKRPDDFVAMAERYDWSDVHRTASEEIGAYELIAKPVVSILADALPASLASFATYISFNNSNFAESNLLDITIYPDVVNHKK